MRHFLCVLVLLCAASNARAYHFEDSLRGTTQGNQLGGTLTTDGWTITDDRDRIWYAMPTLLTGSIEFTLTGVSNDRLRNADHELFTIYEGGYGIQEPIDYGHLKPLFYRVMWRLRGEVAGVDGETQTHQGEQKLIWIMCPDGAPGYAVDYPTTFCNCGNWIDQGPSGGSMTWTGEPERIRIEWDLNSARYLRNGTVVDTIDWTGTGLAFAPNSPHFVLGSPRAGAVSYAVNVIGAVYSDLVVDGVEGSQAVCPGSEPVDAGPAEPLPDAGELPANVLPVVEDVTAAGWEPGVFSDVDDLNIEASEGGVQASVAYLRFPSTGPVQQALLTLHARAIPGAGGGSGIICRVDDDAWSESTLTWSNRPAITALCSGMPHAVGADSDVVVDVTALLTGSGRVNLAIISEDTDAVHYASRESGGAVTGPRLTIAPSTVMEVPDAAVAEVPDASPPPMVDAAVIVTTDAGTHMTTDAGTHMTADASHMATMPDAGSSDAGSASTSENTCGCDVAGTRDVRWLWVLALLVSTRLRKR